MLSHIYRLRPIKYLLGRNELRNQEIYFARPEELNDPMEGFRDIFWQGDEIVSKNLFRHYLLCLERACSLLAIYGEEQPFGWGHIPLLQFDDPSVIPQQKARHEELIRGFFNETIVRSYIEELTSRKTPIRRNELSAHIRYLHPFAIYTVFKHLEQHELISKQNILPELEEKLKKVLEMATKVLSHVKRLEAEHPNSEFQLDAYFTSHQQLTEQLDLINQYNGAIDSTKANKNFVFVNFCDDYVKRLETLVYPDWYTACFLSNCNNSSVWGTYGVNHTGACLKFKVRTRDGRPFISLNRINGFCNSDPIYHDVEHEFHDIHYENEQVPVDFFSSLGRLPIPTLTKFWYSDGNGNRSSCGAAILKSESEWRKRYWNDFTHAITRKLTDWREEHEYRLILYSTIVDFSDKPLRTIKYDFRDLDGIIFGIKTPFKEKLAICKIIEEKCRKAGREDFKFYQAFYSRKKGTIEHSEMGLLRFKS